MTWTQAQLDALDRAIASGALSVTNPDGRSVTYRSLAEMQALRNSIADSLTSSTLRQPAAFVAGFKRDL